MSLVFSWGVELDSRCPLPLNTFFKLSKNPDFCGDGELVFFVDFFGVSGSPAGMDK